MGLLLNRLFVAALLPAVAFQVTSASALTLSFFTSAPTPGADDIFNFTGASHDGQNVGNGSPFADGNANDGYTYVANDRVNQGQTFTTGSNPGGYTVYAVWVRHCGYASNGSLTYWNLVAGNLLTVRVTDSSHAGSSAFALDTETYTVTGTEPNTIGTGNSANGDGRWLMFTLANPVTLSPNKTYGFDVTSIGAASNNGYFEWLGTSNSVFSGGAPYQGGTAGRSGGPDNALNPLVGDRVFLVQLTPPTPPPSPPSLTIWLVSSNQVQISWPATNTGFVLQSSGNVAGPYGYAGLIVPTVAGQNFALDTVGSEVKFYRLQQVTGALPISVTNVQSDPDGATLSMNPGTLKLQVFSPGVVRVAYSPGNSPPPWSDSFSVIQTPAAGPWPLTQTPTEVRLDTGEVEVRVNRASGAVGFYDTNGLPLLVEKPDGGKRLTPASVGGINTLQSQQQFLLPPGEAFYGLGQHQAGIMNYANATVHLQNKNPGESSVPVLLSSRGYGLLWDNPAITDVSVGTGSQQILPAAQLLGTNGQPGGLNGSYYQGANFNTFVFSRVDPQINFNWSTTPPPGMTQSNYSVRWTGFLQAQQAGAYRIMGATDDGMRLWIDNQLMVDDWVAQSVKTNAVTLNFASNSVHSIRFDYYQAAGNAIAQLSWVTPTSGCVTWTSQAAAAIDYYFLNGPELDDVIANYRQLTGPAPMFGRWAWGLWQCKNHYQTQAEILGVLNTYRSMAIPLDCVIQDWQYWLPGHPWGSHLFDTNNYPDPAGMMQSVHAANAHIIISVWPKFATNTPNANALQAVGGLYPEVINGGYPPGVNQWYDPFSAGGRQVYWQEIATNLFSLGLDGWWLDASEPELSGSWGGDVNYMTAAGSGALVFNAFPLLHTTAVYQGHRASNPAKRAFILTRSAFAGQQRNAAVTWSGDINGNFAVLAAQIPAGINFSMSGIPYWNTDTGGFNDNNPTNLAYAEVFTRWFQFSAFCPMFRIHGNNAKEIYRFLPNTQAILINYDQLRYHLLPYIYSVAWKVTSEGYSMMRGLPMDFRQDASVYSIPDQFMFGPALMANPVTQAGATNRSVYLPAATAWMDFWTGASYAGGQTNLAAAPIDTMPLYVRAGSIIPYGPAVQYASQSLDPIELRVYPGADGSFTLYEDEDDNYDYESGAYATIPIKWTESTRTLTIGQRQGSFPGMLSTRTFNIVWVSPGHGTGVPSTTTPDATVSYNGTAVQVPGGP